MSGPGTCSKRIRKKLLPEFVLETYIFEKNFLVSSHLSLWMLLSVGNTELHLILRNNALL